MEIIKINLWESEIGWFIYARSVTKKEVNNLINIIKKLGFKRDFDYEKKSRKLGGNIKIPRR